MRGFRTLVVLVPFFSIACGSGSGEERCSTEHEGVCVDAYAIDTEVCELIDIRPLAEGEAPPFGSSVERLFAHAEGERAAMLTYWAGEKTELAVRITLLDEPAQLVELAQRDEWWACETEVQRLAKVEFRTTDGLFRESFTAALRARVERPLSFEGRIPSRSIRGKHPSKLDLPEDDDNEPYRIIYRIGADLLPTGATGHVTVLFSNSTTLGTDSVATWGWGIGPPIE